MTLQELKQWIARTKVLDLDVERKNAEHILDQAYIMMLYIELLEQRRYAA